ncbi:GCN5 family acetyltransferase [Haloprofundus marisrubri]|uniref:GCN5 family acetyltransferase n=1 Tax=Haloprofundus marisrubri TaxID=1514971 RepID=A0A0W1R580_9EURY|nr:GNAT family N-acetyltransferase [Haloprofundus marisrubri]KTG08468.1 GCN5 family acetyltransferase [Haloprofundus marisrubri]
MRSDLFPTRIETERLRLEPRTPEYVDVHELYRICSSSSPEMDEVTRYLPWSPHETPKETYDFLRRGVAHRENHDTAGYVVRPRENEDGAGDIAGFGGLNLQWDRRSAGLGFWLRPRFWGRGYSGERAAALLELAFEHLDLELVRVAHDPENGKSKRAIEKYVERFGGQCDGTFRNAAAGMDGSVVDQTHYTITQEQWREATDGERTARIRWADE